LVGRSPAGDRIGQRRGCAKHNGPETILSNECTLIVIGLAKKALEEF